VAVVVALHLLLVLAQVGLAQEDLELEQDYL
jgi:hypothetical protein